MRKSISVLLFVILMMTALSVCLTVTACGEAENNGDTDGYGEHTHVLRHVEAVEPTCSVDGNSEYWVCDECGEYFSDSEGKISISEDSWMIPATGHKFINVDICECGYTRDTWGLKYELSEDGSYYSLVGVGNVISANVVIPSSYNGKNVLVIADGAFRDYGALKKIIIPDSVISIGANAFNNCTSLESIVIGSRVTNIGESAFENCVALSSIVIPDNVINIGNKAFKGCTSLNSADIKYGTVNIGDNVFENCKALTEIEIPSKVTSVGQYAFV